MIRAGKASSSKCLDGKSLVRQKTSLNKQKPSNKTKYRYQAPPIENEYSIIRGRDTFNIQGLNSFVFEQNSSKSRFLEQVCSVCGEMFPIKAMKLHFDICKKQVIKKTKKRVATQKKRQSERKCKITESSKPKKQICPKSKDQKLKVRKQSVRKITNKKYQINNRSREIFEKRQEREKVLRPSIKKKSKVHININNNVRSSSNRPFKRHQNTRGSSQQQSNDFLNIFREIHYGFIPMAQQLNNLLNIGTQFANVMQDTANIISSIPRMGGVVWYQNMQPDESFTQVYYDNTEGHNENGLQEDEINQIPVYKYRAGSDPNNHTTNKSCAVCLNDFANGEAVKTLQCQHRYHSDCIDQWLNLNGSCPVCRTHLRE